MKQTKLNEIKQTNLKLILPPMGEGKTSIMKQTKLSQPYEGDDIKDFINQNKYHRTSSEAFRNADYASWFEKDPEMNDMKLFSLEFLTMLPFLIGLFYVVKYVIMYYK